VIIIEGTGGLGNQLFQYAFGKTLAIKHNTVLKFNIKNFVNEDTVTNTLYLKHFNIDLNTTMSTEGLKIVNEPHFHFSQELMDTQDNSYVTGYFQSEKYFESIKDTLKKEFVLRPPFNSAYEADDIYYNNSVGIHVRRGDYIKSRHVSSTHGNCCPMEYYTTAMEIMKSKLSNPTFFIFSDDIPWCKENIKGEGIRYITGNKCWEDLYLMTLCRNFIIANSTFSWWGSYLSNHLDKIIISPNKWFNNDLNVNDLIPHNYLRVSM